MRALRGEQYFYDPAAGVNVSQTTEALDAAETDSGSVASARKSPRGSGRRQADRLSATDWINMAMSLLAREGVAAVRVQRLCDELQVTKGSFYWHFTSINELIAAVATTWCEVTRSVVEGLAALEELPAAQRLQEMAERLLSDEAAMVERALRDVARADERVNAVMAEMDLQILASVERALLDHGLDAESARVRAGILVYAGIGFAHGGSALPRPTREDVSAVLGLLTRLD